MLIDNCLSSGANTFPHQCDESIHPTTSPSPSGPPLNGYVSMSTPLKTSQNISKQQDRIAIAHESQQVEASCPKSQVLLSLRFGGQVFVCSLTTVSALVPTLFLINVTSAQSHVLHSLFLLRSKGGDDLKAIEIVCPPSLRLKLLLFRKSEWQSEDSNSPTIITW